MIEELSRPPAESDLNELAALLVDAVESGASVGFLAPLSLEQAREWWRDTLTSAGPPAMFLVARDETGIVGTVQILPARMPNQSHRADLAKMLVHRRARRRGLATGLVRTAELRAQSAGVTLLTLDTKRGDPAEALYRRAGWQPVGPIPGYALNPDGSFCDTVVFYKQLGSPNGLTIPSDADQAGLAIAAANRILDRALVEQKPEVAAALFTADAVLGESGVADVVGRAAIAGFLARGDLVRAVTFHAVHRDDLIVIGDRAVEFAWFEETKVLHGGAPVHERGRIATDWRREADGAWRIARLVISDLPVG